jgi:hypothetical protein
MLLIAMRGILQFPKARITMIVEKSALKQGALLFADRKGQQSL